MGSRVESRNAPQLDVRPEMRAIVPSSRSEKTKDVITRTPTISCPRGKNHRAAPTTPIVPTTVTASGLTLRRSRNRAIGVMRFVKKVRRCSNMARAGYRLPTGRLTRLLRPSAPTWLTPMESPVSVPGFGKQLPRLVHELGQRPGAANDRHEVLVTGPPRHDVLVQVCGDPRPGYRALVHAEVEPMGAAD